MLNAKFLMFNEIAFNSTLRIQNLKLNYDRLNAIQNKYSATDHQ